jgi:hypothetical protein
MCKLLKTGIIAFTAILVSCSGNNGSSGKDGLVKDQNAKWPIIQIIGDSVDLGTINEGESASHVFKVKNIGNADLIISAARPSCGCTVPKFNKKPISPGSEDEIQVVFNSAGKSGKQHKTVTLVTNTKEGDRKITFTALVIEKK